MGYHTIKTALQRVDDMKKEDKWPDGMKAVNPLTGGLMGMSGSQSPYPNGSFRGRNITYLGGICGIGIEYNPTTLGEPRAGLLPVHRQNGYSFFEDSCVCKDGKVFFYDGNVYDARIPEAPPVRSDVLDPAQKYKAMIESKEDQNDVLLDEITTRFRKSNRLVGWAGVVIAFLALMAATESKWMPLLASVPWFKKAPAQIEGGSIVVSDETLENARVYNTALKGGYDYAVSFDKQGWLEVSNRIFNSARFTFTEGLRRDMLGWSNRIYQYAFEKAATASNCTIFYVPAGTTNLTKLELETIGTNYYEKSKMVELRVHGFMRNPFEVQHYTNVAVEAAK